MSASPKSDAERRLHRRLPAAYALRCQLSPPAAERTLRGLTRDVSGGGVSFELDEGGLEPGQRVRLAIALPAGEGVFPYPGQADCLAEIMRVESAATPAGRCRVAARFLEPLAVHY